MPANEWRGGQNVGVIPQRARRALVVAALAPVLVVSGCGGSGGGSDKSAAKTQPPVDLPTGNVSIPSGVTLTKGGTALAFGQPAVVAYEPNSKRSSVLSMTVLSAKTGKIADFSAYQMDARTKRSTPYYVRFRVKNVGTGDLGKSAVPLLAVDSRDSLIQPSSFNNTFAKCPSKPLPATFAGGKTASGCLVYLVPAGGTLVEMSFRPLQAFPPITWKGTIAPTVLKKKPAHQAKHSKKKAKH